jgi:inorganic pyrophosphatase
MPNLINLPPFTEDGDVYVVVETPRGSRAKFDYDPKLKTFTLSKSLLTGLTYPHDWGFVPSTKADDGDPIDIMVVHDAATFPGIVLTCRVIGILQIEQKSKGKTERNDRLFAVPRDSHWEQALKDVRDLSGPIQQELEKFFKATDELEDKKLNIIGWKGPKAATTPPWHRKWQTSARVVTAETPAMLAQRACADRAIRSARPPGGLAAARRRPIAVALRWPSPTSPGSSTNTGAGHRVAGAHRPPSWSRWYAPPGVVLP